MSENTDLDRELNDLLDEIMREVVRYATQFQGKPPEAEDLASYLSYPMKGILVNQDFGELNTTVAICLEAAIFHPIERFVEANTSLHPGLKKYLLYQVVLRCLTPLGEKIKKEVFPS